MGQEVVQYQQLPLEKKREIREKAPRIWFDTKSLAETGRQLNVKYDTLKEWKKTRWWADAIQELEEVEKARIAKRLGNLSEKGLDVVMDRLEEGDFAFNKAGELIRRPVSSRDANRILSDALDRKLKFEAASKHSQEAVVASLVDLAQRFAELASKKPKLVREEDVTDVIDISEKYDDTEDQTDSGSH